MICFAEEDLLRGNAALADGGVFYGEDYTAVRFKASLARYELESLVLPL